jgi:hypothetical protein
MSFGAWFPLTGTSIDDNAPAAAAAVQLRRAEGVLSYPAGKSAMVFYFYAADDAAAALKRLFADEIDEPGCRGLGEVWFRFLSGPRAREELEALYHEFETRFGTPPVWNADA